VTLVGVENAAHGSALAAGNKTSASAAKLGHRRKDHRAILVIFFCFHARVRACTDGPHYYNFRVAIRDRHSEHFFLRVLKMASVVLRPSFLVVHSN
jgi:hypothetical protein